MQQPSQGTLSISQAHPHKTRCASCHKANLTHVLTRLIQKVSIHANARTQLSFGEPHRISTERLVAARANNTCQSLKAAVCTGDNILGTDCMHCGIFLPSLLEKLSVPAAEDLWSRNWAFYPHFDKNNDLSARDASVDVGLCTGSVSKNVWLDPSRRVDACIESVNDDVLDQGPGEQCSLCLRVLSAHSACACSRTLF